MAIVTAVKQRTQSKTALGKAIRYVSQEKKTLYTHDGRQYRLLSGRDCCGETAFQEFMATKRRFGKESGVFFYQYVQSFKPDENAAPEEIHRMGLELAGYFKGHEVLVATHIDRDHWHNHLIVNSVSHETGLKLQFNEKSLSELRQLSDVICSTHGLDVLKPYEKQKKKSLGQREYRSATRGESWKFRLMGAIDRAMVASQTKAGFIAAMKRQGYDVKWEPHHKYITYTTPDGKKCRDIRLHDDKYLKSNMEGYYAEYGRTQAHQHGDGHLERAVYPDGLRYPQGAMGGHAYAAIGYGEEAVGAWPPMGKASGRADGQDIQCTARGLDEALPLGAAGNAEHDFRSIRGNDGYGEGLDWQDDCYDELKFGGEAEGLGEHSPTQGHTPIAHVFEH